MTVETIGYLVLAVIAIVILYVVLSGIAPKIPAFITQTFDKFKSWLCDRLGPTSSICKVATGTPL